MNIYDLPQENNYKSLKLFIWLLYTSYHLIIFEQYISFLRLVLKIFDISILKVSLWPFEHHIFQFKMSLSLFPSQILVCALAFAAHYLFSIWDLYLLSSLSKNIKIKWEETIDQSRLLTNHTWQVWKSIYNNHT